MQAIPAVGAGDPRSRLGDAGVLFDLVVKKGEGLEAAYRKAVPFEHRKRFGQFFTPDAIAAVMCGWIRALNPKSILDPAVGPGVFPRILLNSCPQAQITCVDIDPVALTAARAAIGACSTVTFVEHDFLTWRDNRKFDAAVANPPYLRHHDMLYPFDIHSAIGKLNDARVSRLSNMYVLFILEICRRLREGGRASVIVPGEWVNANFGVALKRWLLSRGYLHTLVYFSSGAAYFDEALTTMSILLLEKPQRHGGRDLVRTVFVREGLAMEALEKALRDQNPADDDVIVQHLVPRALLSEKKWDYLLSHGSPRTPSGFIALSELAESRRGIATGCNKFFHLAPSAALALRLRRRNLARCIGRATDVDGLIFEPADFQRLAASDARVFLFDVQNGLDKAEVSYIAKGAAEGLHRRYLCAARKGNWYDMEKRPPATIWAAVFGRAGLRFILNADGAANLTTFHCIYPKQHSPTFSAALTACLNSNFVQQLSRRHRRVYGGGLLKFEPKDLLDIEVPDLRKVSGQTLRRLSDLLRELDAGIRMNSETGGVRNALDGAVEAAALEAAGLQTP